MSEVPGSDEGPNPFSFKNFVKRSSTTTEQVSTSAARGQRSARSGSGRTLVEDIKKDPVIIKKKKKKPGGGSGGGESEELPFPDLGAAADAGQSDYSMTSCIHRM